MLRFGGAHLLNRGSVDNVSGQEDLPAERLLDELSQVLRFEDGVFVGEEVVVGWLVRHVVRLSLLLLVQRVHVTRVDLKEVALQLLIHLLQLVLPPLLDGLSAS